MLLYGFALEITSRHPSRDRRREEIYLVMSTPSVQLAVSSAGNYCRPVACNDTTSSRRSGVELQTPVISITVREFKSRGVGGWVGNSNRFVHLSMGML